MSSTGQEEYTRKKDNKKRIRVLFEIIALVLMAYAIITNLFIFAKYKPYDRTKTPLSANGGFVALSYFGVDRIGNKTLIGQDQLQHHMEVLKKQGYVTITQQDVIDYYTKDKALPKKALFLLFEDGRRDTAIFAEKSMEKFNYAGTLFTYANKLKTNDPKFVTPSDMKSLAATGFWEMGTNGYRLHFINVFDRYDNYLGDMNPLLHSMLQPVLGRKYNHYLMDYLRDDKGYPLESYQAMKNRISFDYEKLRDVYTDKMGYVPQAYVLMHANTGMFGNNHKVSDVNGYWIQKLFQMNFNREGYSYNDRQSSIYDLTRMQPQAYWPANHLLMRIKHDQTEAIQFEPGDTSRQKVWETLAGASEIRLDQIILTTDPQKDGRMFLKNGQNYKDFSLTTVLKGNAFGQQKVWLRSDKDFRTGIVVSLVNGQLLVDEVSNGKAKNLQKLDLDKFDGIEPISIDQDKQNVVEKDLETLTRYAPNTEQAKLNLGRLQAEMQAQPKTIAEGAKPYKDTLSYHSRADRQLQIVLKGDTLNVILDNKPALQNVKVSNQRAGGIGLQAVWGGYGWSQRNLADDVYDGVFEKVKITDVDDKAKILYDNNYTGWTKVRFELQKVWEKILNFALTYL
jgi:hypothetical protein